MKLDEVGVSNNTPLVKPANLQPIPLWEYENAPDSWAKFVPELQESIERMHAMGSPHYLYRPGHPECEGMCEQHLLEPLTQAALAGRCLGTNPPPEASTRRIIFGGAIELDLYAGWSRKVRRSGPIDDSGMAEMMRNLNPF